MRQACAADFKQFCSEVKPGGGHIIQCLRENETRLSSACRASLKAEQANKKG